MMMMMMIPCRVGRIEAVRELVDLDRGHVGLRENSHITHFLCSNSNDDDDNNNDDDNDDGSSSDNDDDSNSSSSDDDDDDDDDDDNATVK